MDLSWGCIVASIVAGLDTSRFLSMGIFKRNESSHRLQYIEDLKACIRQQVRSFTNDSLLGAMDSFINRLQQCTSNRGANIMDAVFKN